MTNDFSFVKFQMSMRDNFAETGVKKAKVRASVLTAKKPAGSTAAKAPAASTAAAPSKPAASPAVRGGAGETAAVSVSAVSIMYPLAVSILGYSVSNLWYSVVVGAGGLYSGVACNWFSLCIGGDSGIKPVQCL